MNALILLSWHSKFALLCICTVQANIKDFSVQIPILLLLWALKMRGFITCNLVLSQIKGNRCALEPLLTFLAGMDSTGSLTFKSQKT